jgi:hypothetical protein
MISRSTLFQVSVSDLIFNGLQWLISEKHEDYTMFGTHQWPAIHVRKMNWVNLGTIIQLTVDIKRVYLLLNSRVGHCLSYLMLYAAEGQFSCTQLRGKPWICRSLSFQRFRHRDIGFHSRIHRVLQMNMEVSPSIGDASSSKRGAGKPGRSVSGVLPLLWLCASAKRRWMRQWQLIDLRWSA